MDCGGLDTEFDIDALMIAIDEEDSRDRFAFLDEQSLFDLGKRVYSANTTRRIQQVLKTFCDWRTERNRRVPSSSNGGVPMKLVEDYSVEEMNKWFSAFLAEMRKVDGGYYKARVVFETAIVLQMHMRACGKTYKFFSDPQFMPLRNTVDAVMKDLQKLGLG